MSGLKAFTNRKLLFTRLYSLY